MALLTQEEVVPALAAIFGQWTSPLHVHCAACSLLPPRAPSCSGAHCALSVLCFRAGLCVCLFGGRFTRLYTFVLGCSLGTSFTYWYFDVQLGPSTCRPL
jgi:hypothetical protein